MKLLYCFLLTLFLTSCANTGFQKQKFNDFTNSRGIVYAKKVPAEGGQSDLAQNPEKESSLVKAAGETFKDSTLPEYSDNTGREAILSDQFVQEIQQETVEKTFPGKPGMLADDLMPADGARKNTVVLSLVAYAVIITSITAIALVSATTSAATVPLLIVSALVVITLLLITVLMGRNYMRRVRSRGEEDPGIGRFNHLNTVLLVLFMGSAIFVGLVVLLLSLGGL